MGALLQKDFYTVSRTSFPMLVLALLFNLFPTFGALGNTYAILLAFTIPLSAITADEKCKWDRFAAMLPYSIEQLVWSKYLLTYLYTLAGTAIMLAGAVSRGLRDPAAANWKDTFGTIFMMLLVMLLVTVVSLPLMYRFGTETGRFIMLLVLGAGVGMSVALLNIVFYYGKPPLPSPVLLVIAAAAVVGTTYLSFRLSVYFYRRRREM